MMFKILLLQQWYNLSDLEAEEAIKDRLSFIKFLGLSIEDPFPDETTICRFRNKLFKEGLTECSANVHDSSMFEEMVQGDENWYSHVLLPSGSRIPFLLNLRLIVRVFAS